jgi:hypothetical protein
MVMKIPIGGGTVENVDASGHLRIAGSHINMTSHVSCRWKNAVLACKIGIFLADNSAETSS